MMSIRLWFVADGAPWELLSNAANAAGVFKSRCLLTGRIGYFLPDVVATACVTVA